MGGTLILKYISAPTSNTSLEAVKILNQLSHMVCKAGKMCRNKTTLKKLLYKSGVSTLSKLYTVTVDLELKNENKGCGASRSCFPNTTLELLDSVPGNRRFPLLWFLEWGRASAHTEKTIELLVWWSNRCGHWQKSVPLMVEHSWQQGIIRVFDASASPFCCHDGL